MAIIYTARQPGWRGWRGLWRELRRLEERQEGRRSGFRFSEGRGMGEDVFTQGGVYGLCRRGQYAEPHCDHRDGERSRTMRRELTAQEWALWETSLRTPFSQEDGGGGAHIWPPASVSMNVWWHSITFFVYLWKGGLFISLLNPKFWNSVGQWVGGIY